MKSYPSFDDITSSTQAVYASALSFLFSELPTTNCTKIIHREILLFQKQYKNISKANTSSPFRKLFECYHALVDGIIINSPEDVQVQLDILSNIIEEFSQLKSSYPTGMD